MSLEFLRSLSAGAFAAVLLAGCAKEANSKPTSEAVAPRSVQTTRPEVRSMEKVLSIAGSLAAREQANVSIKVPGRLKTLTVDIGSVVKKGDVVGQVDPRDYELRLQLAQAALAQARAGLGLSLDGDDEKIDIEKTSTVRETKAVLDVAKRNRDRAESLQKQGVASKEELDNAESAFKVAREKYEAALEEVRARQGTLAQRKAEVEIAKQQLTDTNVRIPFDGVIQSRLANAGEYVSAGAQVVSLVQIDPLRLRLEIPERSSPHIKMGQTVRLRVDGSDKSYSGSIARISPAITEENRMLIVEADVPNPGELRPGQFVRADIVLNAQDKALSISPKALIVFAGLEKVVVIEEGKAVEKNVRTGRRAEDWIEVVNGLKENDLLILNPTGLRTGQPVSVADNSAAVGARSSSK